MDTTILHNPACSASRNTLALIRQAGVEPVIVEYLREPPARSRLAQLIRDAGLSVRETLREKEAAYAALGLEDAALTDEQLLDAMLANPILIQRPIVETPRGVLLCRPPERVLEILPA